MCASFMSIICVPMRPANREASNETTPTHVDIEHNMNSINAFKDNRHNTPKFHLPCARIRQKSDAVLPHPRIGKAIAAFG